MVTLNGEAVAAAVRDDEHGGSLGELLSLVQVIEGRVPQVGIPTLLARLVVAHVKQLVGDHEPGLGLSEAPAVDVGSVYPAWRGE